MEQQQVLKPPNLDTDPDEQLDQDEYQINE